MVFVGVAAMGFRGAILPDSHRVTVGLEPGTQAGFRRQMQDVLSSDLVAMRLEIGDQAFAAGRLGPIFPYQRRPIGGLQLIDL